MNSTIDFSPNPFTSHFSPQKMATASPAKYNAFSRIINSEPRSVIMPTLAMTKEVHVVDQPIQVVPRNDLESRYNRMIDQLEGEKTTLVKENIQLRSVQASEKLSIVEDTTRITWFQSENTRLKQTITELEEELSSWKKKYIDFEAQVTFQYGLELDYKRVRKDLLETELVLHSEIDNLNDVIKQEHAKYAELQGRLADQVSQTESLAKTFKVKQRDLENKIAMLSTEMERMTMLVRQKNQECERWKNKFHDIEDADLQKGTQIQQLQIEINKLKELIDSRNAEIKILKQNQIDPVQFENKITLMKQELEKYGANLRAKADECERLRLEIRDLTAQLKDPKRYSEYTDKIFKLESELSRAQRAVRDRDDDIEKLRQRIQQLEIEVQEATYKSEKTTYYLTEADTWKKRFVELNNNFHHNQEALMMAQAEIESLKNRGLVAHTTVTTTKQHNVQSSTKK